MNQKNSWAARESLKYIQKTGYVFLLQRGYAMVSAEDAEVGWRAVLRRADLFLQILHTRGDDYVSFRTGAQMSEEWFDLENVVYAATGEKIPSVNGSEPAKQLQQYLDRIETYFAGEYVKNPEGLRAAQEAAQDAARAAYQEMLSQVQTALAKEKEPKKTSVLNYLLIGIILLLIFFFMVTLFGVLVDRLFFTLAP